MSVHKNIFKNIYIHKILVSIETSQKVEYIMDLTGITTWLSIGGFLLVLVYARRVSKEFLKGYLSAVYWRV